MLAKKIKTYWHLKPDLRRTCCEAFFYLFLAKLLIWFVPMRFFAQSLGIKNAEILQIDVTPYHHTLLTIKRSIQAISKNLPWNSKCLDQAMAAQWMLARRKLPSTLYLGLKKSECAKVKYDAHAWVRCGNQPLVGCHLNVSYVVVGTYSFL